MDLMDYRRKIIANSPHLKSASGAVATFSDGAELPLESLVVDIEPVQSGTGDPSPTNIRPISGWNAVNVTRSGESALKPSTAFTETKNGLTFTSDGKGTYSVKGTNTATATVRSAILPVPSFTIPPSTTHTLYINNNAINSDVLLSFMNGSNAIDSWAFNALNRVASSYGAMGNKLCDGIQIVVRAGQTVDITFSPMLLPKENTDVIIRSGGNLLSPHVYTGIAYNPTVGDTVTLTDSATQFTDNGNGVFTVTTSSTWRYFSIIIPIDPTKEYATKIVFNSTGQAGVTRGYLDADFKILTKFNSTDSAISWEYSLIPEANAAYYYFVFTNRGTASATLTLTQPQFVGGTTVGDYEPYTETFYGGTLNPLTGVMTVDRAMVDLGTLNWTRINTQSPHWRFWAIVTEMLKDSTLMSNQYAQITPSAQWTGAIGIATQLISGTPAVMVTDERYETAADFKTAMSGVQLVYELATPYEVQLTPHQIRSLYGSNTIFADTGNISLEYWAHP